MKAKLVLIGNGMAGGKLLEEIVATCADLYDITVFGNEPYGNYNRIMLSPLLAGDKTLDDIMINHRQWYTDHDIQLHAGEEKAIVKIDRARQQVIAADGSITPYHRLVIATGSQPFILPVEGAHLEGVISFRDIADVEKMITTAQSHQRAIVIGGGLLGLEAAMGLTTRGMQVTVVHNHDIPLNRQLDAQAGMLLKHELVSRGLSFKLNASTHKIIGDEQGRVTAIQFDDGSKIETDLIVMAVGIRPNIELAKSSGVYCEKGIIVNDTLQTYDPRIYALGECIEHRGDTFGLVAPLYDQAKVLVNHLSEHGIARYQSLPTATKLKVTGIHLFSMGKFLESQHCETLIFQDDAQNIYKKLVIENETLVGVVLYGDTKEGAFYSELIDQHTNIKQIRPYLMFGRGLCDEMSITLGSPSSDTSTSDTSTSDAASSIPHRTRPPIEQRSITVEKPKVVDCPKTLTVTGSA